MKLGLVGSTGKMGQEVTSLAGNPPFTDISIFGSYSSNNKDIDSLANSDVILDFSIPTISIEILKHFETLESPPRIVIGTTGWNKSDFEILNRFSKKAVAFYASNFSIGISLLNVILSEMSDLLDVLGFTNSISETHHAHKRDKPSGTAVSLAETIQIHTNKTPPIESIRIGEVVGDHQVKFETKGVCLVFSHYAKDRSIFAFGALNACQWIQNITVPGLYGMNDLLNDMRKKNGNYTGE